MARRVCFDGSEMPYSILRGTLGVDGKENYSFLTALEF